MSEVEVTEHGSTAYSWVRRWEKVDLTGWGFALGAALVTLLTIAWWLRLIYHGTYSAPGALAVPLALAFLSGILCTMSVTFESVRK